VSRQDDAGLAKAIEKIGAGNILLLLDEPNGREHLLGWLTELRDLRASNSAEAERKTMDSLIGFHGLSEEDARRVLKNLLSGVGIEFEIGSCRKCKGTGRVELFERSGCFGIETRDEECFTCSGTGTDKKRIKVPEAT
jgi:hypothetical protein